MKRFTIQVAAYVALAALCLAPSYASAAVTRNGELKNTDKLCPHRPVCYENVHKIKLHAGQTYVIDLESNDFDPFLILEDTSNRPIAWNDDGGVGLNSRIVFTPSRTGIYLITVTTYRAGDVGRYMLRVVP